MRVPILLPILLLLPTPGGATCPNGCSKNGVCSLNNTCTCEATHMGADCSMRRCPNGTAWADFPTATDVAHASAECSNMGTCNRDSGRCKCRQGFTGAACDIMRCPGSVESGKDCSGHGMCITMRQAAETVDGQALVRATSYSIWDADKIVGCACDAGWMGYDCSLRTCPLGDDPLETASGTADELQVLDCLCGSGCAGSVQLSFRGQATAPIAFGADAATIKAALEALLTVVEVAVAFDGGTTMCDADGVATKITFTHQPGDLPDIVPDASGLAQSSGTPVVEVRVGGATSAYGGNPSSVTGNREAKECSNRGICDRNTGVCACSTFDGSTSNLWSSSNGAGGSVAKTAGGRGDCGFATGTVSDCPTAETGTVCSGHGTCSGSSTFLCTCDAGYMGPDCSLRSCQTSRAWFDEATSADTAHAVDIECSNRGICDRTAGTCTCDSWATGTACGEISCPSSSDGVQCSGSGSCQAMSYLATQAKINGVTQSFTYGQSGTLATWDYNKVYACLCDKNMYHGPLVGAIGDSTGYDCQTKICPLGDDPHTTNQVFEVQGIKCTATSGTLSLSFRSESASSSVAFNAAATDLEDVLESISQVRTLYGDGITVSYSSGSSLCTSDGSNVASVTFTQALGDLPLMGTGGTGSLSGGATLVVSELIKGNKENSICSNRGRCDSTTGQCQCYYGYTSSDGNGNGGSRGDCGHMNPLQQDLLYPAAATATT